MFKYIIYPKNRIFYFYDLEIFQKLLNDYMIGNYISTFNFKSSLEAAAYTLTLAKYLGIKKVNKKIKVIALQVHSATNEPMMSLFQADRVLSINKKTSIYLPQVFSNREEVPVGSRLFDIYRFNYRSVLFKPTEKNFLVLLGNTLHPNGNYYGPFHNKLYKDFLDDLIKISKNLKTWKFYFLHHKNFHSNYEINYLLNSPFIKLDHSLNAYSASLKHLFVVSFSSTVVTELYTYHPNIYLYSPNNKSPFRVSNDKFRMIFSYSRLMQSIANTEINASKKLTKHIYYENFAIDDFDERIYKSCLK